MHPTASDQSAGDARPTASLVEAAMLGDRASLERLWADHRRYAATVILAHKPADADADDLLQDVAATLVTKIQTLSDPGAFLPWLRMVALNVARLAGRKRSASPVKLGGDAVDHQLAGAVDAARGPESRLESDRAREVMALAGRLPEEYREPLLLQTLRDLSYRQIARVMDLPETTVETRIARARRMLRELAREAGQGSEGPARGPGGAKATGTAPARILSTPDDPR